MASANTYLEVVMELNELNTYGKFLEDTFKLRSLPIGVKFYESAADVPEEAVFPLKEYGKHMAVCQAFSYARMKGKTIAMTKEDHWCWNPLIGYGCVSCEPGEPQFDEVIKYIGIPDREKASAFFQKFPRLPLHKYEAVVMAPISTATFLPDVIMIYADVAKINYFVRCIKGVLGDYIHSVFDGIDSCIYCTLPTFTEGKFRITLPDPGERERALTRDDEVILSIPPAQMDAFMKSVEANQRLGFHDKGIEINLDYSRPPFYNRLFEMWGLEKGANWDLTSE